MTEQHIPLRMELAGNFGSPDERRRKCTNKEIYKILILVQTSNISYRSSMVLLLNLYECLIMLGISDMQSFQTLSRRPGSFDLHPVYRNIKLLYSMKEYAVLVSFVNNRCRYTSALRRKYLGN